MSKQKDRVEIYKKTTDLDEAVVGRVLLVEGVLVEHFTDDVLGRLAHRQQQRLVRHVLAQRLAVDLQRPARVRTAVLLPSTFSFSTQKQIMQPMRRSGCETINRLGLDTFHWESIISSLLSRYGNTVRTLDRNSCNLRSSFCWRRLRITASGLLMERVKLVSGSSARRRRREKRKQTIRLPRRPRSTRGTSMSTRPISFHEKCEIETKSRKSGHRRRQRHPLAWLQLIELYWGINEQWVTYCKSPGWSDFYRLLIICIRRGIPSRLNLITSVATPFGNYWSDGTTLPLDATQQH